MIDYFEFMLWEQLFIVLFWGFEQNNRLKRAECCGGLLPHRGTRNTCSNTSTFIQCLWI